MPQLVPHFFFNQVTVTVEVIIEVVYQEIGPATLIVVESVSGITILS